MGLSSDFVCCCIPLLNVGIYFVLLEQLVTGFAVGVIAFAGPTIVGAAVPAIAVYIFGALAVLAALTTVFGVVGVVQEKKGAFKIYSIANLVSTLAALAVGAVLIVISGIRQSTAISNCQKTYYATDSTTTSTTKTTSLASQSKKICEIFGIVDLGILAGLWVLVAIVQLYFISVARVYQKDQTEDHRRFQSIYSTKGGFPEYAENIPLSSTNPNGDVWNARQSEDLYGAHPTGGPAGYQPEEQYYGGHDGRRRDSIYDDGPVDKNEVYRPHEQHHDQAFAPPQHNGYGNEHHAQQQYQQQQQHDGHSSGGYAPEQYQTEYRPSR